jgi:hypothetical protein
MYVLCTHAHKFQVCSAITSVLNVSVLNRILRLQEEQTYVMTRAARSLADSTIGGVFQIAVYATQLPNDLYCTHPLTSPYLSVAVLLNPTRPYTKPSCLKLKNTAAVAPEITSSHDAHI